MVNLPMMFLLNVFEREKVDQLVFKTFFVEAKCGQGFQLRKLKVFEGEKIIC